MSLLHLLLALAVVFVWGTNFVIIAIGLDSFPPLFLATLRFLCSFFPWIFFIPRPKVPIRSLIYFGILIGGGQFGLIFIAMQHDISPGIASILIQSQTFFTIIIFWKFYQQSLRPLQIIALLIALAGYILIAEASFSTNSNAITMLGFLLVLVAAMSWTACNLIIYQIKERFNMLAFMIWASAFATPVVFLLSFLVEGPQAMISSLHHASLAGWLAALWQGLGNTLFGFGVWYWLITRYSVGTISPFALLVPIFGMSSSMIVLGETFEWWKMLASVCIISGLALNLYASKKKQKS